MIAGQLPFKGEYGQAVVYSILNEQPDSLVPRYLKRTDFSTDLKVIISMEKLGINKSSKLYSKNSNF